MNLTLDKLVDNFIDITKPENFISTESECVNRIKSFVKYVYDLTKKEEGSQNTNSLPELIIEDFDLEQIWQQLELQNEELLNRSLANVSKLVVSKNRLLFDELDKESPVDKSNDNKLENDVHFEDDSDKLQDSSDSENEENREVSDIGENNDEISDNPPSSSSDDELDKDNSDNQNCVIENQKSKRKSVVDDEFFKLEEMEEFLKAEEKALNRTSDDDSGNESKEDEEVDYFESEGENVEEEGEESLRERNPRYKDFFQTNKEEKQTKRNKFLEDNEDEDRNKQKSTFELRQDKLKGKIKILEDIALSEKPWQLQGEITAENRPVNSLLEEVVEFDITSRPAPVITEKTTLQLEDIIRQRIKDKAFDSVERKKRPVETPLEYKKKLVLDQEKSKESLAQIYEKEYLQQVEAASGTPESKEEEEPELHKEIRKMMWNLFRQLDALSNYHFTPKPAAPEIKIISNLPAINMEEVAPISTTDASLLAPEEVRKRIKGDIIGKSERTDTDKNRERRKKKLKQKTHASRKNKGDSNVKKFNPGLGNKYSKDKIKKQLSNVMKDNNVDKMDESIGSKSVKSSTAFFKQLEDEVKSQIREKSQAKRKKQTPGITAKKMKL